MAGQQSEKSLQKFGSKLKRKLPRFVRILVIDGDIPLYAFEQDHSDPTQRAILRYLRTRYVVCQFKSESAYNKGRRLTGQKVRIGKFQGLVEPLGYQPLPLPESAKKAIRREYRDRHYSVAKLADDWDVSASHIRQILKKDKPRV